MAPGKKHWVPILAPSLFKNEQLGESFVLETETLAGRGISVNLMNVTGDMKKQHMNVAFRITDVRNGKAATRVTGITMQNGSVKRLVRRGRSKLSESFLVTLQHGQVARIKPLIVTKTLANNSIATALRHRCREVVTALCADMVFETLVQDIVSGKFQHHVRDELSAIFPIRSVDVRDCHLLPKHSMEEEHEASASSYGITSTDDDAERG